jgi:DNA-binding SARP family transcriptional activator/tetratricopeptide (TPR) repeat protein
MQFRVLGPVEVIADDGRSVDVGGSQSRAVLAMLLVADDRIVPVETILDRLWPERQPASAGSTLQSYVSRLRRALRSPTDGQVRLAFESGGYRLTAPVGQLDAHRFAADADRGRALLAEGSAAEARAALAGALDLWRGPALQDVADQPWARGVAARLDERRLAALEDRLRADLLLGRHDLVVGELHDLVADHPLREGLCEQLAIALYRSGRQAEALRAIDDLRRRLVDELGVDPSHRIRELETQILGHDPALAAPRSRSAVTPVAAAPSGPVTSGPAAGHLDAGHPGRGGRHFHGVVTNDLIGRDAEQAALAAAIAGAAGNVTQWVLIEGEPGIGKTRLLEQLSEHAAAAGFDVLWGRSYESGASPAFWTWMGTINGLADVTAELPEAYREAIAELQWSTGPRGRIDQTDAMRYQVYEALAQLIVQAGRRSRLVIALDDLQWADGPSLELIEFLAGYVIGSPVLFVATVRELEIGRNDALVHAMADLTRRPTARRLHLRGLDVAAAGELVRDTVGADVGDDVVRAIHRRADGNPFFMTELARLYAADPELTEGEVVRRIGVPAGVRDVVHRRLAHLGAPTVEALQMVAVLGPLAEVGLLAAAMGATIDDCLDRLEPALGARLLLAGDAAAGAVRFSHGLVGEVLLDDMSALRRARLHLKAADAIEARSNRAADVAQIVADHLWQASSVAAPERVAVALEQAAMVAIGRFGLENADALLERALQVRRQLPADRVDVGAELAVISRLAAVRRARYGYQAAARQVPLARARELAGTMEESVPLLDLMWTEWAAAATAGELVTSHRLATELVDAARQTNDPLTIAAVAASWGVQCWHEGRMEEAVIALDRAALNYAAAEAAGASYVLASPLADHWTIGAGFHAIVHQMTGQPIDTGMPSQILNPPERVAPHEMMTTALCRAMVAAFAGEYAETRRLTESALAVGLDEVFGFFVPATHCFHAVALLFLGETAAGVAELTTSIERYIAEGALTLIPFHLTRLALGHLVLGDTDAAAAALERAEQVLAQTGERWNEPFVLAARAAHAAAVGDAATADALLDEADAVALGQGAHGVAERLAADLHLLGLLPG